MMFLYFACLAIVLAYMSGGFGQTLKACCEVGCVECGDKHPHRIVHSQLYLR